MNCEPLKKHIIDTVKEWQMKIGYRAESMKLYYPAASLAELLELPEDADKDQLNTALLIFAKEEESSLGDLAFSEKDGRWNLTVPPEGCTWIHENFQDSPFLKDFIQTITTPGNTLTEVRACFDRHTLPEHPVQEADHVHDGVGRVFFYEGGAPDEYVYCVESDDFGLTYHRFTMEDYRKLL